MRGRHFLSLTVTLRTLTSLSHLTCTVAPAAFSRSSRPCHARDLLRALAGGDDEFHVLGDAEFAIDRLGAHLLIHDQHFRVGIGRLDRALDHLVLRGGLDVARPNAETKLRANSPATMVRIMRMLLGCHGPRNEDASDPAPEATRSSCPYSRRPVHAPIRRPCPKKVVTPTRILP